MSLKDLTTTGVLVTGSLLSLASYSFSGSDRDQGTNDLRSIQEQRVEAEDSLRLLNFTSRLVEEYRVTSDFYQNQREEILLSADREISKQAALLEIAQQQLTKATELAQQSKDILRVSNSVSTNLDKMLTELNERLQSFQTKLKELNKDLKTENSKIQSQARDIQKLKRTLDTINKELAEEFEGDIKRLENKYNELYKELHGHYPPKEMYLKPGVFFGRH